MDSFDIAVRYRTLQMLAAVMNDVQQKVLVTAIIVNGIPINALGACICLSGPYKPTMTLQ